MRPIPYTNAQPRIIAILFQLSTNLRKENMSANSLHPVHPADTLHHLLLLGTVTLWNQSQTFPNGTPILIPLPGSRTRGGFQELGKSEEEDRRILPPLCH